MNEQKIELSPVELNTIIQTSIREAIRPVNKKLDKLGAYELERRELEEARSKARLLLQKRYPHLYGYIQHAPRGMI